MKTEAIRESSAALLSVNEVAALMSVSARTVWRLTAEGVLPQPVILGKQLRRWRLNEIEAHAERFPRRR